MDGMQVTKGRENLQQIQSFRLEKPGVQLASQVTQHIKAITRNNTGPMSLIYIQDLCHLFDLQGGQYYILYRWLLSIISFCFNY